MAVTTEILHLQFQITKLISNVDKDQDQALDILKSLNDLDITLDVLNSTRIGLTVNTFRKCCTDNETKRFAKKLLTKWKQLTSTVNSSDSLKSSETSKKKNKIPKRSIKIVDNSNITNNVRAKCRIMIFNALSTNTDENLKNINFKELADQLEECIFEIFKNTGRTYRYRVISRIFNLKDPKNPDLRMKFALGSITPALMATLTNEEMASDEKKNLRALYRKEEINKSHMATVSGTSTSLLQCKKCHKKNCTYSQMQTRSSDEPMTTFAMCKDCGNRWKF